MYVKNKKRMTIDAHNIFRLSARFYSLAAHVTYLGYEVDDMPPGLISTVATAEVYLEQNVDPG